MKTLNYQVFGRTWWDGQGQPEMGRKTNICKVNTEDEAREVCRKFNDGSRTPTHVRRGYKYEYTSI